MIDTKILNPLDVPTAKPSEIVRNWPDAMWGVDNSKRVAPDGHVTFCAIGILGEMSGFDWGEPDLSAVSGAKVWRGFTYSRVSCFVAEKYHLSPLQLIRVYDQNDLRGKVAAADALESLGL